jgi:O-antigen polysaccharide polymerase Wzy
MLYNAIHLCIALLIQTAAMVGLALFRSANFQSESLIYPCCCCILVLTLWYLGSWFWLTRRLFDPYTLFLFAAVLFNAGQAYLEVLHLNRFGLLRGQYSAATLANTLFFVALGLSAFHLGALLSLAAHNAILALSDLRQPFKKVAMTRQRSRANPAGNDDPSNVSALTVSTPMSPIQSLDTAPGTIWIGWGLASIAVLPSIYDFLQSLRVVLTQGYQGLYQGEQETSFGAASGVLGGFLMTAAIFLLTGSTVKGSSAYSKRTRNVALGLMVLYIISRLLLGQRNKVGTAVAAVVWLWHWWVAKLPTVIVLGTAIALSILFPIIAATRNLAGQSGGSLDALQAQTYGESNPLISTLSEMGGTMMTTASTIDLVPSARPFQMGADYGYALLTLFPNLFWKIHPTIERGLAGNWLTWAINPEFASRGGGYGYSFIAEAYLNFGWIGGPMMLGLIGFLFASLTLWAINSTSAARIALIATFAVFFPFYARSESALHVRALVWYAAMPYWGAVGISKWLDRRKLSFKQRRKARSSWLN